MIVVQKYGGTSVGSVDRVKLIAKRVAAQIKAGQTKTAIVVSAMSGETNRLVGLMKQANPNASEKSYDVAVSAGEQVSVGLMSAALEAEGLGAEPFLAYQLGIRTDSLHSRARIVSIECGPVKKAWDAGRVPVVAGFQGVTEQLDITTLGRGGSDTSAVALAVALGADFCEINTDVNGVYTADPRVVPDARLIERLDYELALELSSLGSKVLHSRCVELAAKFKMPLVVRNSFDPEAAKRTEIVSFTKQEALEAPVVSGITLDSDVAKLTISGGGGDEALVARLFARIAKASVNVDIIVHDRSTSEVSLGFTVGRADVDRAVQAIEEMKRETGSSLTVTAQSGLAKVSAVGLGMSSHSGVASKVFSVLTENGVPIQMVSTSEIKISCVVPLEMGEKATRDLHAAFFA